MDLTYDHIEPFLSERGRLEVELAALRYQVAAGNTRVQELEAEQADERPDDGTS